jgi:hypothetical protein
MSKPSTKEALTSYLIKDTTPVSFREFVTSPEYLGQESIYEFWLNEFTGCANVVEFIIDGSIGGGKTTAVNLMLLYRLYLLFREGDPRKQLGIKKGSLVYCLYFSTTLTTALKSGFGDLKTMVDGSKWFKENFPRDKNLEKSIKFPNGFSIDYASSVSHQLSLNVWGYVLDEADYRGQGSTGTAADYDEVTYLYTQLLDRQISRFSSINKETGLSNQNTFAALISSASFQSSFVQKRKEVVKKMPNRKCVTAVKYKITPDNFAKETFEVFCGSANIDPEIIVDPAHKERLLQELNIKGIDFLEADFFEKVPVNLRDSFEASCALALQNHCGRATMMSGRFMRNIKMFIDSYMKEDERPRWFSKETGIVLGNKSEVTLLNFFNKYAVNEAQKPHSFFLDLSLAKDAAGFSCFRFDEEIDSVKYHTHIFTLEIVPPAFPQQTKITRFREFMVYISKLVNVAAFATDGFQSDQLRQEVDELLALNQEIKFSIDSSDEFHLHWMRALIDKRVKHINLQKLQTEVEEAEHDLVKRKIVKRQHSTDDLFQSMIGAFFLSDTEGSSVKHNRGNVDDYYKRNVIGGASVRNVLRGLGYK